MLSTLLATFMLAYYTDTALLGAAAVSTMFLLSRILDGTTDLIMGAVVDKTNTRWGKARPWILLSSPLLGLAIILLFNMPLGWSSTAKLVYAYLTYIFANCIVFTIFGTAHAALLARITFNQADRTLTATISMACNVGIGLVVGTVTTAMVIQLGWGLTSIIWGLVATVLLFLTFIGVPERIGIDTTTGKVEIPEPPVKVALGCALRNRYFYILLLIAMFTLIMNANALATTAFYCKWVLNDQMFMTTIMSIGNFPGLVTLFLMPLIAKRWSKRTYMAAAALTALIGFLILGYAGQSHALVILGSVLRSGGTSPIFAGIFAFVADISDWGEWKTGIRTEGLISASQNIGTKIGIGLGSGLSGWVLAGFGYDGARAVQSAQALAGIRFSFGYLGAIFAFLLLITILFMDVEKNLPEIQAKLKQKYTHSAITTE